MVCIFTKCFIVQALYVPTAQPIANNQLYQTKCITDSVMQFRKRMFMLFNAGSATLVHSFILSNYVIRSNCHGGF